MGRLLGWSPKINSQVNNNHILESKSLRWIGWLLHLNLIRFSKKCDIPNNWEKDGIMYQTPS